jgi:hypothetical protein
MRVRVRVRVKALGLGFDSGGKQRRTANDDLVSREVKVSPSWEPFLEEMSDAFKFAVNTRRNAVGAKKNPLP